jgi:hypothetical protein
MSRRRRRRNRSRPAQALQKKPAPAAPVEPEAASAVDVPLVIRGASVGFTVLVVGELVALAMATAAPGPASLLLALTGAAGSVAAAYAAARSGPPAAQGALAAVAAYLLTVPLRLMAGGVNPLRVWMDLSFALVIGWVAGRRLSRTRSP